MRQLNSVIINVIAKQGNEFSLIKTEKVPFLFLFKKTINVHISDVTIKNHDNYWSVTASIDNSTTYVIDISKDTGFRRPLISKFDNRTLKSGAWIKRCGFSFKFPNFVLVEVSDHERINTIENWIEYVLLTSLDDV